MPAAKSTVRTDRPQLYSVRVEELEAGGGIVHKVITGYTAKDRVGVIVRRAELFMEGTDHHSATMKGYSWGMMCSSHNMNAPLDGDQPAGLIFRDQIIRVDATAVGIRLWDETRVYDVPIEVLAHPASLFIFYRGINQGAAYGARISFWYDYVDLSDADYQDILQLMITSAV